MAKVLTPNTIDRPQNSNLQGVNTVAEARKNQSINTLSLHEQSPLIVLTPDTLAAASIIF